MASLSLLLLKLFVCDITSTDIPFSTLTPFAEIALLVVTLHNIYSFARFILLALQFFIIILYDHYAGGL